MKITNHYNILPTIYNAISAKWYSGENEVRDFSITELNNPPKMVLLMKRYRDKLVVDAMDLLHLLQGSAMHYAIEMGNKDNPDFVLEERYSMDVGGFIITGGVDCYQRSTETVIDYKNTKVYGWIMKDEDQEDKFRFQLNGYKLLIETCTNLKVKNLVIGYIFKDFSFPKYIINTSEYPLPVQSLTLPVYSNETVRKEILSRIENIVQYQDLADDDIPICPDKDRWLKNEVFAVMKKGRKSAVNGGLCSSEQQAQMMIDMGLGDFIEHRVGNNMRCEGYCQVAEYCNFGKKCPSQRFTTLGKKTTPF